MNLLHWLEQHPNAALVAVIAGSVLLLFFAAWLIHYYVIDWRYWFRPFRGMFAGLRRNLDFPGPDSLPAPRAGEYDDWDADWQAEPWTDADADQLITDLTTDLPGPVEDADGRRADPSIGLSSLGWAGEPHERAWSPALVESLTDDPDLLLWDIRCQVTRIQEIRAELADLKRELCPA